jgi:hypothetical protein
METHQRNQVYIIFWKILGPVIQIEVTIDNTVCVEVYLFIYIYHLHLLRA